LFSSGPMSHGFAQAIRTGMEQRATALADHFAPLFASQNPASAAAGMAAAPAMSTDESQTAQGATDAEQPQETVAESSTSPTAATPSSTADGADDVDQARTTPAGASNPHSPLPSSSSTSQTAASPVDLGKQWWEQSLSPAKSTDDGRCSTQEGGQEEVQRQPSSVHDHLRKGAMKEKRRQSDAVDRRYARVSATQAQSVARLGRRDPIPQGPEGRVWFRRGRQGCRSALGHQARLLCCGDTIWAARSRVVVRGVVCLQDPSRGHTVADGSLQLAEPAADRVVETGLGARQRLFLELQVPSLQMYQEGLLAPLSAVWRNEQEIFVPLPTGRPLVRFRMPFAAKRSERLRLSQQGHAG
jgi:hypothetical protein